MPMDGIPTARVPGRPYSGGKYGIRRVDDPTKFLSLKRPFGSITAAYKWLDEAGYSVTRWETCRWQEYLDSAQYQEEVGG